MKKKYTATVKDKLDWVNFIEKHENIYDKDADLIKHNNKVKNIVKIDLHGMSLNEANQMAKKFIIKSFKQNYEKLLIVTGKGLRSKIYNDPYRSKDLNVLKYSVPDYISADKDLSSKIIKISKADLKDGGEGAIYVYLKRKKKL